MIREGFTRVEYLHGDLRPVHRFVPGLCFYRDDGYGRVGVEWERDVYIVDFGLTDTADALADMAFEVESPRLQEAGDEVVVPDHRQEALLVDLAEFVAEQLADYSRGAVNDEFHVALGEGDEGALRLLEHVAATPDRPNYAKTESLDLLGDRRAGHHPVDDVRPVGGADAQRAARFRNVGHREFDGLDSGGVFLVEDVE